MVFKANIILDNSKTTDISKYRIYPKYHDTLPYLS